MNVTEIKSLRQNTARLINDGQIHRALADIRSFALANNDHTEDAALDRLDADYDDGIVRMVRFTEPISIAINGRSGQGLIQKPD